MPDSEAVSQSPQITAAWKDAKVTCHDGTSLLADADWFAAPPEEIGELRTAYTSLKVDQQPWPLAKRVIVCAIAGLLVVVAGELYLNYLVNAPPDTIRFVQIASGVGGLLAMQLTWYLTRFSHQLTYVGKLGMCRFTLRGNRDRQPDSIKFCFNTASELRTGETRNYHNGVYTGTHYYFRWIDNAGNKRLTRSGSYRSEKGSPKTNDVYWYYKSGELAWCEYLFDAKNAELQQNGYLQFNLSGNDFVRVGPGFFEFGLRGSLSRVTPADIIAQSEPRDIYDQNPRCALVQQQGLVFVRV